MPVTDAIIPVVAIIAVAVTIIFAPMARAYARQMDGGSRQPPLSDDVTARLERMEAAIDSIAVEVERISEGQRFTTKLLSERAATPPSTAP